MPKGATFYTSLPKSTNVMRYTTIKKNIEANQMPSEIRCSPVVFSLSRAGFVQQITQDKRNEPEA